MFRGSIVALVTPFLNGGINFDTLKKLFEYHEENKTDAILLSGTTGESPTLSFEEKIELFQFGKKNSSIPIIAGTGNYNTKETIEMTKEAESIGVDGALVITPYYNKPTQEGFYRHYTKIAERVDLPLIVYNIPGRSGKNIENSTTLKLAEHPNIVGVKEASGNINQMMDLIREIPTSFIVLSGDDNFTYPLMALGGSGVVSVASNIIPDKMVAFCEAALKGDFTTARKMHYELLPLFKAMFIETNPIPIKTSMVLKGMVNEVFRLPICPMLKENKEKLITVLKRYNLI